MWKHHEHICMDDKKIPSWLREGFRKKKPKKMWTGGALWGGGGSGKIFAGPQFYCDFWKI